ncbi:hypothetical protein EYF80_025776 [Liparis tanakae]|uniref:Uncharacterized protein n=1 Tax=Liparis tanakae TaxID=230148 RepID=A0A4Z2HGG3_9TELE|nr:hypothetical protein EYF80_025776 [Liparis tanakae]
MHTDIDNYISLSLLLVLCRRVALSHPITAPPPPALLHPVAAPPAEALYASTGVPEVKIYVSKDLLRAIN